MLSDTVQNYHRLYQESLQTILQYQTNEKTLQTKLRKLEKENQLLKQEVDQMLEELKIKTKQIEKKDEEINSFKTSSSKLQRKSTDLSGSRMNPNNNGVPTVCMDFNSGKPGSPVSKSNTNSGSMGDINASKIAKSYELMKSQNQLLEKTVKNLNQEVKRLRKVEDQLRQEMEEMDEKHWNKSNRSRFNSQDQSLGATEKVQVETFKVETNNVDDDVIKKLTEKISQLKEQKRQLERKLQDQINQKTSPNGFQSDSHKQCKSQDNNQISDIKSNTQDSIIQPNQQQKSIEDSNSKHFSKAKSNGVQTVDVETGSRKQSDLKSNGSQNQKNNGLKGEGVNKQGEMQKIAQLTAQVEKLKALEAAFKLQIAQKDKSIKQLIKKENKLQDLQWEYDLMKEDWVKKTQQLKQLPSFKQKANKEQKAVQVEILKSNARKTQGEDSEDTEQGSKSKSSNKSGFFQGTFGVNKMYGKINSNGIPTVYVDTRDEDPKRNYQAQITTLQKKVKVMVKELQVMKNTQQELRIQLQQADEFLATMSKKEQQLDQLYAKYAILQQLQLDSTRKIQDLTKRLSEVENLSQSTPSTTSKGPLPNKQTAKEIPSRFSEGSNNMFNKFNSNGVPTVYVTSGSSKLVKTHQKSDFTANNDNQKQIKELKEVIQTMKNLEYSLRKQIQDYQAQLKRKDNEIMNSRQQCKSIRNELQRKLQELSQEREKVKQAQTIISTTKVEKNIEDLQKPSINKEIPKGNSAFSKVNSYGVPNVTVDFGNSKNNPTQVTSQSLNQQQKQIQLLQKNIKNLNLQVQRLKQVQNQLRKEIEQQDLMITQLKRQSDQVSELKFEIEKLNVKLQETISEQRNIQEQALSPTFRHIHKKCQKTGIITIEDSQKKDTDGNLIPFIDRPDPVYQEQKDTLRIKMTIKLVPKDQQ